jgi:signal transduction histidine kinase/ActR/RegA family two-component response regulator
MLKNKFRIVNVKYKILSNKYLNNQMKINNYEVTVRGRDGKETVVSYNATTFYDQEGKLQGVFGAARDITERKQMDQMLQEKNAELESAKLVAEKANLAKSEFLSSMSHELRSPLNAILGFAQLLASDSPPPTAIQMESLDQILEAGWHLLKLINEILDLAKIESGQVPLSLTPLSLTEVILECWGMMEPQAQQQGIKMTLVRMDTAYFVYADRTRVKQVLINLLSNAIKYNSKQGTVELQCAETPQGCLRVSVRDTGEGLDPGQMAQLFQPFNRLGQEAGDKEGTGIGLVVAKRLVELMEGVIGVDSTVGLGSVFWFELLPLAEPHLAPQGGDAMVSHGSLMGCEGGQNQATLLYIEDNPANLKLVRQIIARRPTIRLLTATDGYKGIGIAREARPDVILTDINLAGINGFEVLDILRSDSSTAHIAVIALSANAMPRTIEKGLKAGFFSYITKPIKVDEFMEALDRALEFAKRDQS